MVLLRKGLLLRWWLQQAMAVVVMDVVRVKEVSVLRLGSVEAVKDGRGKRELWWWSRLWWSLWVGG